jgi:hypothetical protein
MVASERLRSERLGDLSRAGWRDPRRVGVRQPRRHRGHRAPYLERGEYSPSLYLALKIAEYFEVPVEVIFSTTPFARIGTEIG